MYRAITFFLLFLLLGAGAAFSQQTEFSYVAPNSEEFTDPFTPGVNSGARGVSGPYDTDNDGSLEVLVTDYSGGGRIYVFENAGPDTWELVWATPFADSTGTSNARYAVGDADLDGDGSKEIVFYTGAGYSDTNPRVLDGTYRPGMWIFEHTGADNDFGTLPAFICEFDQATTFFQAEQFAVYDIDGDGIEEILAPQNNGGSAADLFYVYNVVGEFEPDGAATSFATCANEFTMARGQTAIDGGYFNLDEVGGGSPYAILPADLDGNGSRELSIHTWNFFNFFNVGVDGPDSYSPPDPLSTSPNLQASFPDDHVALFGGTVVDIDGNGDDEVFYSRFQSGLGGNVSLLNYEENEDITQVTTDNFILDLLSDFTNFGIAAGDMTGDGNPDLVGAGFGFTGSQFDGGETSSWIRIAAWLGGNPEDASSYSVRTFDTSSPVDTAHFSLVVRDSAGVTTTFHERALPKFATKIAYLGDADNDGFAEVAVGFQSVPDSIEVIDELFRPDSLSGVFNTPVGASAPGPIGPGDAYEFEIDATPGSSLSFATMFIPSNDLFFAPPDSGLALWDNTGAQRSGDVTAEVLLWDAGTELNEEPGNGPNQAPNQSGPNTGEADTLTTVRLVNDGFTYPAVADVIQVTLTPDPNSNTKFTVRIENVSTATTLGGTAPVPMAPGVYAIHTGTGPLFTEDADSPGNGLEALAEDGNPSEIRDTFIADFGSFRSVRERVASPNREFMRIVSSDGFATAVEDTRFVVPSDYVLSSNYPNPFNPSTSFTFRLPVDKRISVKIFDVTGRLIATLVDDEIYTAGTHQATWNGTNMAGLQVASGTYLYTLEYGNFRQAKTMLLIK